MVQQLLRTGLSLLVKQITQEHRNHVMLHEESKATMKRGFFYFDIMRELRTDGNLIAWFLVDQIPEAR